MNHDKAVYYRRSSDTPITCVNPDNAHEITLAEYDAIVHLNSEHMAAWREFMEAKQRFDDLIKSCEHDFFFDSPSPTDGYARRTCAICSKTFAIKLEQVKC